MVGAGQQACFGIPTASRSPVYARYYGASTGLTSGVTTALFFPTRTVDSHNAYDPSSFAYVVPVTGLYQVDFCFIGSGNSTAPVLIQMYLVVNGVEYSTSNQYGGSSNNGVISGQISDLIQLSINDRVLFKVNQNGGSSISGTGTDGTRFSLVKVG